MSPPAGKIQEDFANFFASREVYDKYRIPWKRGVLLIGPPGNGKTHTVKALINQTKQPCLYVKSFKSCWGIDHDRIREVFTRARKTTPSIVVLEDLDSLIDKENRAFFLNELDGFARTPESSSWRRRTTLRNLIRLSSIGRAGSTGSTISTCRRRKRGWPISFPGIRLWKRN